MRLLIFKKEFHYFVSNGKKMRNNPAGSHSHDFCPAKADETLRKPCATWGVQVLRYPNIFSGMEADRNVKVVGGDATVL